MCPSKVSSVLVVDDLPDNVFLLQVFLESEGYDVVTAYGGHQALDEIHQSPPDLVLLDLMMPDLDGWEVTRRIRQNPAYQTMPILLLTAYSDAVRVGQEQGLNAAVNGFLLKPFDFEQLLVEVQRLLSDRTCGHS